MAASSRRKPRARRSAPARPTLEQRHWDLIGLGLVALAVFLSFLVYLGWEGGTVGTALVDGLKDLVGQVHVLVPVALLAAGAIVVMRPVLPAVRPFRAAAAGLLLSTCLAFAAGTFGLGGLSEAKEERGGQLGEWLDDGISTLLGGVGSHVIAIFLFLAGVLLLTGASIAGVLKATGD
jgi:DNA segregation ATPase FtsK/SpoIIIE, S-DNA-T family